MHSSMEADAVSSAMRGASGASYGALIPVNSAISSPRLAIQALGIAPFAGRDVGRQVDLEERAFAHDPPRAFPVLAIGRDERGDDGHARLVHEFRDLRYPPDVLPAVLGREAEVAVEPQAQVVAVEHVAEAPGLHQPALDGLGERRLPGSRKAREPHRDRLLSQQRRAITRGDLPDLAGDVAACGRGIGVACVGAALCRGHLRRPTSPRRSD